jgi:hypothetical protein
MPSTDKPGHRHFRENRRKRPSFPIELRPWAAPLLFVGYDPLM